MGVGSERRRPGRARAVPAFVGRDGEITGLQEALAEPPAVVLVEGEAGIGKTRLLQECLASPEARQSQTLVATCPPFRESLTLGPIVDAIRQAGPSIDRLQLSPLAGSLRPLFPEWADHLPPAPEPLDDAKAARHRLLSALGELVERLGVELLVVDDAHWADESTVEFLLLLMSRQGPPSLLVSYRPEDIPVGSLLWRLSSHPPAAGTYTRMMLYPLDMGDTTRLVSSMLDGEPLSGEFATFLYERTDGVPLLVEESVLLLRDRADLVRRDGGWLRHNLEELQVPPTVRDSTLERVRRLATSAQRVLEAAAVLAEPADEAIVMTVAGLPRSAGAAGVQAAVASGLVDEDDRGGLRFRHQLPASAIYEAIPGVQRRRLHLRAGQALEEVDPLPVAQLCRHFREAGETAKWAVYAERAADQAVASNDHTTAARLLNDVLTSAALPGRTRARLAPALARATLYRTEAVDDLNRDVVSTLRTVLDAQELSPSEQADIRNPLGRLLMQLGDWETGYRELELAAASLGHAPVEAARVMTYLGLPFVGLWPASAHRKWLRRAAEVDLSVQSPVDRIMLTADRATALVLLGEEEGWELAGRLPTTAPTRDERRELARANFNFAEVALRWGRYAIASRRLVLARELSESDGYVALRYGLRAAQADLDWFTGAWDGLADRVTTLLNVDVDEVEPSDYGDVLRTAGRLRAAQGARGQAEKDFRMALDRARLQGLVDDALEPAAGLARLRLAEGRIDDALAVTEEPMQALQAKGVWVWATEMAPVRVQALSAAGRMEEAGRLVDRFARGLYGRDAPGPKAALALCRAILAEHQDDPARAAAAYGRAARAWERLPRPYDVLLARERQALCLLGADRAEAGLALLADVFEGLTELGASGDADRVATRLRQHGVEARRPWRGGRKGYGDQLSPRELEVVRLVVAGRSNREIAQLLSKSHRTVGVQLRTAMRKLGVSSRATLAVAAVEAGLAPGCRLQDDDSESAGRPC